MKKLIMSVTEALLLMEMPYLNTFHTSERLGAYADNVRGMLKDLHSKSKSLGNGIHYHKLSNNNGGIYYKMKDGTPNEMSHIDKNDTQVLIHKGTGDASTIMDFMHHHIKNHGHLYSDEDHTEGSKTFWKKFIQANPQYKYHLVDVKTSNKTPFEEVEDHKIWTTKSYDPKSKIMVSS